MINISASIMKEFISCSRQGFVSQNLLVCKNTDIDFEENTIRVDHQLQRKRDMEYIIEETKTLNGERILPMTKEVRECFEVIISKRRKPKVEPTVRD